MDYKYIEQLLERYWQCETSLQEEQILRAFFQQEEVPAHLQSYRAYFAYTQLAAKVVPGEALEARVLAHTDQSLVHARHTSPYQWLTHICKAAAIVAVMVTIGTIAHRSFTQDVLSDYNYDEYTDTHTDPQEAYGDISNALMTVSEHINRYREQYATDSAATTPIEEEDAKEDTTNVLIPADR